MDQLIKRVQSLSREPVEQIKIIKSGWSNIVVEVNQKTIYRFPRKLTAQFEVEKAFLSQFSANVPTPRPVLSGADFIAYKRLEGERFDPTQYWQLSQRDQKKILGQLGSFLTLLHASPFSHPHLSQNEYGSDTFWEESWPLIGSMLSKSTQQKAKKYFEGYFDFVLKHDPLKTIVHGDLGTNNLLADFAQARLTGIIDFSDMCLGDPASDFAGFQRHFGDQFVIDLLNFYDRPEGEYFWQRIEFSTIRKRFFIVYFAYHNGFEDQIPSIIKLIESSFEKID